jgi:hypothetical protein
MLHRCRVTFSPDDAHDTTVPQVKQYSSTSGIEAPIDHGSARTLGLEFKHGNDPDSCRNRQ